MDFIINSPGSWGMALHLESVVKIYLRICLHIYIQKNMCIVYLCYIDTKCKLQLRIIIY